MEKTTGTTVNETGNVIFGRMTDRDGNAPTEISLFQSGTEYMFSCIRLGMKFLYKDARFYDSYNHVTYDGCYFCDWNRAMCEKYARLMRWKEDGVPSTITMGQEQAKKQLSLEPEHDGLGYIKYVAQTGDPFQMEKYHEIEEQFEGDPHVFTVLDAPEDEKVTAECAYWCHRFNFYKTMFSYERECDKRDESWFYGDSASSSSEDGKGGEEEEKSTKANVPTLKRKRDGVDKRASRRAKKKRKFYCLPLPAVMPLSNETKDIITDSK